MHLHLVRHGQDTRRGERTLTAQGLGQARAVAARFARQGVTHLRTAAQTCARQTAVEIFRATGVPPAVDDRLDEIRSGPHGDARTPGPRERLREPQCARETGGSETWNRFLERVSVCVSELCRQGGPGQHIVLVTHSGVFDALLEVLCGTGARIELAVAHTGITHWEYRPGDPAGSWLLHGHNDTTHLAPVFQQPEARAAASTGDPSCG
ncbi:histidine phosphatase family protein [Streptomyces sp. NPDC014006]|uniref:histidine phosphatase family protein n=1 Tax=Streptomyces sp. NPDC014006 TaxID=3364870 RepID=UPI003702CADB